MHTKRDVGRERPRRRRPSENIGIFRIFYLEFYKRGRLFYVLIALRYFVRRKRRSATGAIGHDFMTLIQQAFLMNFFERPPFGLDIIVVIGNVRVVHIAPVPYRVGHFFPFRRVLPNGLFTLLDKRFYTVAFNTRLTFQTQLFLYFKLYGKTVRIPPRLSQNVVAFHGLITGHDIFHNAR